MKDKIIKFRKNFIGPNLSISYDDPLHLIKSKNQYVYDHKGKKYLDAVNNINHIGHCNMYVAKKMIAQSKKLNINSRYLYENMRAYTKKLLKYFPKNLNVVYYVCSGSEANDLALRIANNYTKGNEIIVVDNAYHGHTKSLIDISPYKFKNKGGTGKKNHVHILDMPDGIRGKYRYKDNNWIKKYIQDAKNLIDKVSSNKRISAFYSESILGCGGQVVLPKNYLKEIFKKIRSKKGICISDEVQTGFGRVGNNFWAFQNQDVIPDIVTLGKPMGNGHPIAALITTKKIAKKFNNGMEYFNSFGGNPVSLSIGESVLEFIEKKNLQKKSFILGNYLIKELNKIKKEFPEKIIEVRGQGLFVGVDLVKKGNPDLPDKKLAQFIINNCRKLGVLISTDGPYNNVLKIKPPIIINKENIKFLVNCIRKSLLRYK